MQFLRGAGTVFRLPIEIVSNDQNGESVRETLEAEIVHLPRLLVRRWQARFEALTAADLPRRSQTIEILGPDGEPRSVLLPTTQGVLDSRDLLCEIVSRAVIRVHGLRVENRDGSEGPPVIWEFEGRQYCGAPAGLLDLIEDADLLETIAMAALGAQRPTVQQAKSYGSPPSPSPTTSPVATHAP